MMDTHVFGEGVEFFQELAFVLTQFRPSKNEVEVVPEHEHPQEHDFHQPVEGFANKKLCVIRIKSDFLQLFQWVGYATLCLVMQTNCPSKKVPLLILTTLYYCC
jgi:hypothetical protein